MEFAWTISTALVVNVVGVPCHWAGVWFALIPIEDAGAVVPHAVASALTA